MDKVEKAIYFATKAHNGQNRKMEDVAMIFHPFTVGMILQRAGCCDDIIISGLLHDVIEDTPYTKEDIEKRFGKKIANIVDGVSESDKSLPWKVRKQETIDHVKDAGIEVKLVECADKINNLESIYIDLQREGEEVWSKFKRGREDQEWYHRNVYESIIANTDKKHPLFKRQKVLIKKVFG